MRFICFAHDTYDILASNPPNVARLLHRNVTRLMIILLLFYVAMFTVNLNIYIRLTKYDRCTRNVKVMLGAILSQNRTATLKYLKT